MKSNSVVRDIVGIGLVSLLLALVYNALSPKGIPLIRKEVQKEFVEDSVLFGSPLFAADTAKKEKELAHRIVTMRQVKRLLNEGRALLIDARNADEYKKGYIKGAVNIPFMEIENYFEELLKIPQDTLIVVYCNNPECPLGHRLMEFMLQVGFISVYIYEEGWDEWKAAGEEIEKPARGNEW